MSTAQGPVVATCDGCRQPGGALHEAHRPHVLRRALRGETETANDGDGTPRRSSRTHPLFPPLPLHGPPSPLRTAQCLFFRVSSFFLSLAFLGAIVVGALLSGVPTFAHQLLHKVALRRVDKRRPFYQEERRRADLRKQKQRAWERRASVDRLGADREGTADEYPPTQGGRDPIVCDVGYYAKRVGLDVETFKVQTEDGFIIELWHVYDPNEHAGLDESGSDRQAPAVSRPTEKRAKGPTQKPRFPVLLIHGLLQNSGAYCCSDDESLAFWLCKSGFDVWLGNNRCGFEPQHAVFDYGDPRMWCWNIRQMSVFDLPALTSRVLSETGFRRLGLVCHSQGTAEAFVALAKDQRPDLGDKLTVLCALAPAAYAGPLIGNVYFRLIRMLSPAMFTIVFGIHAFIPFMMLMHRLLHPRLYGWLGYTVFSYLFAWTDVRWDRGLRGRMFQFSPVYVSAESMRWWLGRECFAKHNCILATKETTMAEERMDGAGQASDSEAPDDVPGATAWYNNQVPPLALWVCGSDDLVDGRRLLRRFEMGREPHVKVVHSSVIDEYEHLDVIWAVDAVDRVFKDVREVLWKTCDKRNVCRVPVGCEAVEAWDEHEKQPATDGNA